MRNYDGYVDIYSSECSACGEWWDTVDMTVSTGGLVCPYCVSDNGIDFHDFAPSGTSGAETDGFEPEPSTYLGGEVNHD